GPRLRLRGACGRADLHQVEDAPAPSAGRRRRGPAPGPRAAPSRVRAIPEDGRVAPRDRRPARRSLAAAGDAASGGGGERDDRSLSLRPDRGIPEGHRALSARPPPFSGDPPPAVLRPGEDGGVAREAGPRKDAAAP